MVIEMNNMDECADFEERRKKIADRLMGGLLEHFNIERLEKLPASRYEEALEWISNKEKEELLGVAK